VAKMHHSTVDGVSGANLLVHLLDLETDPPPKPEPEVWEPDTKPSDLGLIASAVVSRARRPARLAVQTATSGWRLGNLLFRRWVQRTPGMATPLTAPRTSFNTSIT